MIANVRYLNALFIISLMDSCCLAGTQECVRVEGLQRLTMVKPEGVDVEAVCLF